MKKYYWLKRRKPSARLISDYSNPNDLKDRYAPPPTLRFVDLPIDLVDEAATKTEQESVEAACDCVVRVEGMACEIFDGVVGVVSGNEPTKPLKNMNTAIHRRLIPAASDLGHDPKYGGWIDPFKGRWGQGKEKKKKTYEYY